MRTGSKAYRTTGHRRAGGAFTLVELLVVIGVIAVLVGIGLAVGLGVLNSGRDQLTQNTISVFETILADFEAEADLRPREYAFYEAPATTGTGATVSLPLIDARGDGSSADASNPAEPSMGRFLKVVQERVPSVESRWTSLDSALSRLSDVGQTGVQVLGVELLDAWGNPIRFVHPQFDGGYGEYDNGTGAATGRDTVVVTAGNALTQYRRSYRLPESDRTGLANPIGDGDEGICPSGRPYAYSAGADGDPGTREDNVYGDVTPTYPAETRDLGIGG